MLLSISQADKRPRVKLRAPVYVTMAIDPALTDRASSDATGITIVATDPENCWWVFEAEEFRGGPADVISRIVYWAELYQPQRISIEVVAAQIVLAHALREQFVKRLISIPIHEYRPGPRQTKRARIEGLQYLFKQNKIVIRENLIDLRRQLDEYPEVAHDDLLDSLAQHLEIARAAERYGRPAGYESEEEERERRLQEEKRQHGNGAWVGLGTPRR